MSRQLLSIFLVLISSLALADRTLVAVDSATPADKRVALVIGNAAYKDAPLKNPVNDAKSVAHKLRSLGFDVLEKHNLTQRQIGRALSEFRSRLSPGATALFFYAGHGLQVNGVNYLPAVDAEISAEEDVPTQSIDVNKVLGVMEGGKTGINLVFLDACRNNPYARGFRSAGTGLARVEAPSGSLIFYATRPGSVAADGEGQNGLYTRFLLEALDQPGLTVEQVQKRVAVGVEAVSRGRQEPWMEGLLKGDFYFRSAMGVGLPPVQGVIPLPPVAPSPATDPVEEAFWSEVIKADDASSYKTYLGNYPDGVYASVARDWLEKEQRTHEARVRLRDGQAWEKAQGANSYESYREYLKSFPVGRYAELARLKLKNLHPPVQEPEMVVIPGRDFEMGKYEVTQAQWRSVMDNNPSGFHGCNDCPVENVSWFDVQEYLGKLNQYTGKRYRLPTVEEWKYACNGAGNHEYCGGSNVEALGWYKANSGGSTHPVGQKQANAFGLFDMTGNVLEWGQECYEGDCALRVLHGSSWGFAASQAIASSRSRSAPSNRINVIGFRVVRTLP